MAVVMPGATLAGIVLKLPRVSYPGEGIGGNQRRQMSGCGARTAAGSLEAVFESSDVERFGYGRPKPKVYFEEWDNPLISGIGWVSELIEIAGGEDVFPELRKQKAAKDRIVSPHDVIAAAPDVIVASWCGKKVVLDKIRQRSGWDAIPAVRNCRIVEIKSALILQPGPAAPDRL